MDGILYILMIHTKGTYLTWPYGPLGQELASKEGIQTLPICGGLNGNGLHRLLNLNAFLPRSLAGGTV